MEEICLQLMDEYVQIDLSVIHVYQWEEDMLDSIYDLLMIPFHRDEEEDDDVEEEDGDEEEEIIIAIENAFELFKIYHEHWNEKYETCPTKKIADRIAELQQKEQPSQRTKAWHDYRYNLLTASNAYKALGTTASINSLICEKCMKEEDISTPSRQLNLNSSMHWGQKYEPVSLEIYEKMNHTKVADFGCLQHETYSFLGASPDGINVCETSPLYGRMLEIKNVVSRTITGIPKKDYWIQMQLQMEVCDLNECDFLETKFMEYESERDYLADRVTDTLKGYFLFFMTSDNVPKYVYKPIELVDEDLIEAWDTQQMEYYESQNMNWISRCYWKLEVLSCVLVHRNRNWFASSIEQLQRVWNIILVERENGEYVKRLPASRKNDSNRI
jgi:putative phage-type endonuclease